MNLLANGTATVSAQMRGYRSQVAQTLLDLLRTDEAINDIGWDQLERVPAWTLLKTQDLLTVTREIGMVVLAPALKKSIDGTLLKTISSSVDASFLRRLLSAEATQDNTLINTDVENFTQQPIRAIEQAGASVLLSTIENMTLVGLLARRFEGSHELIDSHVATDIVEKAENIKASSIPADTPARDHQSVSASHPSGVTAA